MQGDFDRRTAAFDHDIGTKGWALFERLVPETDLAAIRRDVLASVDACAGWQVSSGAASRPDGTAHHSIGQYASLDGFLERGYLHDLIARYFGGAAHILHAFNPASVPPAGQSYLHRIHRDVRTYAGEFRLMLNMLVMIDPFTLENGATHVLSGSHRSPAAPDDRLFWQQSERLVAPAGSVVLFDSNLWHAAGSNTTDDVRTALTLSFSRAFVKQQMDYPRFLHPEHGRRLSPRMRQLLGFNAMVPTSYEEFYRPAARRLYQADQG